VSTVQNNISNQLLVTACYVCPAVRRRQYCSSNAASWHVDPAVLLLDLSLDPAVQLGKSRDSLAQDQAVSEHAVERIVRPVDRVGVGWNLVDVRHQLDPVQTLHRLLLVEVRLNLRAHTVARRAAFIDDARQL